MNAPLLTRQLTVHINGQPCQVPVGCNVAAALAHAGLSGTRRSVGGEARAAFCGMGQCQECRVRIDGTPNCLACMTPSLDGMRIETEA
ncbi:(2Fe-2S)-binding protein [Paucibacter sp. Y2R2-4]|uniref:(2Fe-2S)-binding protein n=1 Tax=Paucibacter sp. Y2R2-4 TaxID=2893553 RepID=UPI0021E49E39|nr:(2Fe-2S)-binding protein [Paucibacter sp. Y2R2-4]MCV2350289.1 (2Fe-2S)-binding protein [Paucibacter sp. Y2R2-4]